MSQPADKLEQSIAAELDRLAGKAPAIPDETPPETDETPPETEEVEEVDEEVVAAGPGDEEEEEEETPGDERVGGEPAAPKAKKGGRANQRIQDLARRAQAAEARVAQVEAQRIAEQQEAARRAQEAEDRRLEAEIAALPLEEQPAKRQEVFNRRVAQRVQNQDRILADMSDQQAFRTQADADPILKALSPRVEQVAAQYRAQGQVVNRETIANYLLGQLARSPEGRRLLMQKPASKKPKRTPTSRGDAGRGGGGGTTRKTGGEPSRAELAARLRDKPI